MVFGVVELLQFTCQISLKWDYFLIMIINFTQYLGFFSETSYELLDENTSNDFSQPPKVISIYCTMGITMNNIYMFAHIVQQAGSTIRRMFKNQDAIDC